MELNKDLKSKINFTVDSLINVLKKDLLSRSYGLSQRRGLWDRFKNWMSNMVYGRYGSSNPYYFINKLGDLGGATAPKQENTLFATRLKIQEYKNLSRIFESFERNILVNEANEINPNNILIIKLLNDLGTNLKNALSKIVTDHMAIMASAKSKVSEKPVETPKEKPVETPKERPVETPKEKFKESDNKIKNLLQELESKKSKGMPEKIYLSIKDELESSIGKDIDPKRLDQLKDMIHGLELPKETESKSPEEEQKPEEFPFYLPNNKDGLLKIMKKLKLNSKYKKSLKEWLKTTNQFDLKMFNQLEDDINAIISEERTDSAWVEMTIRNFKVLIYHIIKEKVQNDETMSFESYVTPYYALSLSEKNQYFKELLMER